MSIKVLIPGAWGNVTDEVLPQMVKKCIDTVTYTTPPGPTEFK